MERLLQILIQAPAEDIETDEVQPNKQNLTSYHIVKKFKELQKKEHTGSLVPHKQLDPQ